MASYAICRVIFFTELSCLVLISLKAGKTQPRDFSCQKHSAAHIFASKFKSERVRRVLGPLSE